MPSEDYYSLIESRYNKIIANIIESFSGPDGKLNYEISQMGLFIDNEKESSFSVTKIQTQNYSADSGQFLNTSAPYKGNNKEHLLIQMNRSRKKNLTAI